MPSSESRGRKAVYFPERGRDMRQAKEPAGYAIARNFRQYFGFRGRGPLPQRLACAKARTAYARRSIFWLARTNGWLRLRKPRPKATSRRPISRTRIPRGSGSALQTMPGSIICAVRRISLPAATQQFRVPSCTRPMRHHFAVGGPGRDKHSAARRTGNPVPEDSHLRERSVVALRFRCLQPEPGSRDDCRC